METRAPLVSVIISTFNRSQYLKRAIESVLNQAFRDFELIVVDNASIDNTQDVLAGIKDQRIRYVRHEINKGGPAARNTGIKLSRGNYIALLDDDDEWLPGKLEKQVNKMRESSSCIGLVYVGSEVFNIKENKIEQVYYPQYRGNVYKRLLLSTFLSGVSNVMIKKECFDKAGLFDEQLSSCQDWDMWLRIACDYEFDFVPGILVRINVHGEQISTNYQALIPGRTRMVEKHRKEFEAFPEIFVVHLKRVGKLHCINGTWKEAVPWFRQAITVNPLEIFKITAWCVLELPFVKWFSSARNFKRYSA